jgi:hypothetical protein
MLSDANPYDEWFKQQLDAIHSGIWNQLDLVPTLAQDQQTAILQYLLELACQATYYRNIELGRAALQALPRSWLLMRIETVAEHNLDLSDDWEFLRLGELYLLLDKQLAAKFATSRLRDQDANIREAAQDLLDMVAEQ